MNFNKIEDDEENLSNYYDHEEDSDDNKEKTNVKYYKNQPYDMAFNINESIEENSSENLEKDKSSEKNIKLNTDKFEKMNLKNKESEEDDEDEEDNKDKKIFDNKAITDKNKNTNTINQTNSKPLPKFDMKELTNFQTNAEIKNLLQIMNK
jgi:hypothetical protein